MFYCIWLQKPFFVCVVVIFDNNNSHALEHVTCCFAFSQCLIIAWDPLANINSVWTSSTYSIIYRFSCGLTMICSQGLFLRRLIFNRCLKFYHLGKNMLFYFCSIPTLTHDLETARTFSGTMIWKSRVKSSFHWSL